MNTHRTSTVIPRKVSKLLQDLLKLEKIGKISSIEIDLDFDPQYHSQIVSMCHQMSGVFYSAQVIFINYPELGFQGFKQLLSEINTIVGTDQIQGLLVNMYIPSLLTNPSSR